MNRSAWLGGWLVVGVLVAGCDSDAEPGPPREAKTSSSSSTGSGGAGGAGAGGAGGDSSSGGGGGETDPRFDPLIEAIEAERIELGAPGVAVAVIEDGKVTFARGFGSKDPDANDPVLPTTLFRIGSVTKMLTTTLLLQEVAAGHVDLEAPTTDYVPEFHFTADASWASTIRIQHLLTHSSGMADYLEIDGPSADSALEAFMTGTFGSVDYLMAPSGAFWNYSNPNFYMAGLVAETTIGKPYRQAMKEGVFDKLGMDRTFFLGSEVIADGDYARGLADYPGIPKVVQPDSYDNAWGRPAGYATSNVLDLAKFVGFLLDGDESVLPKSLREAMQTTQIDTLQVGHLLGYGYALDTWSSMHAGSGALFYPLAKVGHGGDIPGFAADVDYVPSLRFGVVFLANADAAHFSKSFTVAVKTLNTLPEPSVPDGLAVDPAKYPLYAGTYHDAFNVGDIIVTETAGGLEVSMPDVDAAAIPYDHVLKPFLGDAFYLHIQGIDLLVTFVPDEAGTFVYFRTRPFVGAKPPMALAAAKPKAGALASLMDRIARLPRPRHEARFQP